MGPDGQEIGFFWDDPFVANKLTFKRLFNNEFSHQGFTLDLTNMARKTSKLIDLNCTQEESKQMFGSRKQQPELTRDMVDPDNEDVVEVTIEKAFSGDGLLITISKLKNDKIAAPTLFKLFPRKEDAIVDFIQKNSGLIKINISLNSLGISFNDETPKEIFFFSLENLLASVQLDSKTKRLLNTAVEVGDIQGDYQISKGHNKVMLTTKRSLKKKKFTDFFILDNQLKPCLKFTSNFTYQQSYTKLMTFDVKLSLLIVRLDGKSFSRLHKLLMQLYKLFSQGKALIFPNKPELPGNKAPEVGEQKQSSLVTLRISKLNSDIVFENVPDLISTFSQTYIS